MWGLYLAYVLKFSIWIRTHLTNYWLASAFNITTIERWSTLQGEGIQDFLRRGFTTKEWHNWLVRKTNFQNEYEKEGYYLREHVNPLHPPPRSASGNKLSKYRTQKAKGQILPSFSDKIRWLIKSTTIFVGSLLFLMTQYDMFLESYLI